MGIRQGLPKNHALRPLVCSRAKQTVTFYPRERGHRSFISQYGEGRCFAPPLSNDRTRLPQKIKNLETRSPLGGGEVNKYNIVVVAATRVLSWPFQLVNRTCFACMCSKTKIASLLVVLKIVFCPYANIFLVWLKRPFVDFLTKPISWSGGPRQNHKRAMLHLFGTPVTRSLGDFRHTNRNNQHHPR